MRFWLYGTFFFLLHLIPILHAAPTTSTTQSSVSAHITSTHPTPIHHLAPTSAHSFHKPPHITLFSHPPGPPQDTVVGPVHTREPKPHPPPPPPHSQRRHQQKPIVIFFEILGGLVGFAFLLGFIRCFYVYKRTPKRDRIAAVLNRHHLERELEELERNPMALRRTSLIRDPAPPYFPPPPSYDTPPILPTTTRRDYAEVPTASPPASPPTSSMSLLHSANPLATQARPDVIFRTPNG